MQSQIASRGEICPIQELNESLRVNLFFPCCWGFLRPAPLLQPQCAAGSVLGGFCHLPFPASALRAAAVDAFWAADRWRRPGPPSPCSWASLWQKMKTSWPCYVCFPTNTSGTQKVKDDLSAKCYWGAMPGHCCPLPSSLWGLFYFS